MGGRADIEMTKKIIEAGKRLGISVHDNIIIGRKGCSSMKGLLLIQGRPSRRSLAAKGGIFLVKIVGSRIATPNQAMMTLAFAGTASRPLECREDGTWP